MKCNSTIVSPRLRHIGLVVGDLNFARRFWMRGLGFRVLSDVIEDRAFIERLLPGTPVPLRTLKLVDDNSTCLELLQFGEVRESAKWSGSPRDIGLTHIALSVASIEMTLEKLAPFGCQPLTDIQETTSLSHRVVYCQGPEGLLLELVETVID